MPRPGINGLFAMTEIGLVRAMLLAYGIPLFLLLGVMWMVGVLLEKLEDY